MRAATSALTIGLSMFAAALIGEVSNSESSMAQPVARIYLAGPLGFSEAGDMFKTTLVEKLSGLGYEVVDPFKLTPASEIRKVERLKTLDEQRHAWKKLNDKIARTNQEAIDRCDAVLAILDGPDVDSGTAAEIGYAFARKKPILGYRGDFRLSADNLGATVNLQVEYFIRASGGGIVTNASAIPRALSRMIAHAQ